MPAAERRLARCPNCDGSGDPNRKVEFRQGTVGAWASKAYAGDECSRCSGEGLIYEPVNLPPPVRWRPRVRRSSWLDLGDAAQVAVLLGGDANLAAVREDLREARRERYTHVEQPVDDSRPDARRLEVADDLAGRRIGAA